MNRILERLGIDETLSKVRMKDKTYNKVKNHVPMIEDYNQMLDFINDDVGENGEEDDFLAQIENLWQNNGNSNHIVLGHQLGLYFNCILVV